MIWYRNRTYRTVDGVEVPGATFPAFVHNFDYHLTNIVAYQDGMVECWGLVPFDEFKRKVAAGWVVTSVPEGAWVSVHNVARFRVADVSVVGPEAELVKDVAGAIDELNGRPPPLLRLLEAVKGVRGGDAAGFVVQLREAFAATPAYSLKFVFGSRMEKYKDVQEFLTDVVSDAPLIRKAEPEGSS